MDLRDCLVDFLVKFPQFSKKFDVFTREKAFAATEAAQLMSALSELLMSKDGFSAVSEHFGPLLLDLLHRAVIDVGSGTNLSFEKHVDFGVCLAKLSATYPFALSFALEYFKTHPPIFNRFGSNSSDSARKKRKVIRGKSSSDVDVVRSAHQFLLLSSSDFRDLWDWTPIVNLLGHSSDDVKWFSCLCCCTLFDLSASQVASFLKMHFKADKIRELTIRFDRGGVGPISSGSQLHSLKNVNYISSDRVANVCGVLLPCYEKEKRLDGTMVPVSSTCTNLYSLALAMKRGLPVLLQGPIGCGKTAIVEHVAAVTGRSEQPLLLKVQLGDQTDSKILIGTYQCTEVPGEFVWRPGALLTAVEKGYWILLEDIDYAPMDVISMLIPLLETRSLVAPGQGRTVKAAPGFQLFATRRLLDGSGGFHTNQLHTSAILDKLFTKISMEPLSVSELSVVIRTRWPCLDPVVDRLVEIYLLTCSTRHELDSSAKLGDIMPADSRPVSTRDLLKWCHRVADNFKSSFETSAILTFQDAFDCFCAGISRTESKIMIAEAIAARLNISKTKAEYFCTKHKPTINCGRNTLSIGRANLPRLLGDSLIVRHHRSTFAFTRQASFLLEQIAVAVCNHEPVLLVGETGTGKTATVQYLAEETRRKLVVINMNQHSDSSDLLGGFKPVDMRLIVKPIKEEYEQLFCESFSRSQNAVFLGHVSRCFSLRLWVELFHLMMHTQTSAVKRLLNAQEPIAKSEILLQRWHAMKEKIEVLQAQVKHSESALAFTFVEGSLVRALQDGHWILLDEVNLASAETLDCLGGLLENAVGSVLLLERGDLKTVKRHPDFRLFACMNPATDVGKRELPPGLRNRLTEIYMEDLEDSTDLRIIVQHYLKNLSVTSEQTDGIVKFYLQLRGESSKILTDGTGRKPHYSLRTLCRALSYAAENPCQSTPRSLYEAFCMSFLTQLDRSSHPIVQDLIVKNLLAKQNVKSVLLRPLPEPRGGEYVNFEGFWIPQGGKELRSPDTYILTASVRRNLLDLARVVAAGRHPVLLQGDTSVGKTSLVKWLADASGHQCVRVNNHEHTDLQEYVGSYAADSTGRLVFKEGVLVNAMRQGDWIILDELNLAPTDVLEALNRVLDDNRELFITETQETVKADPNFCLFATQNPPGHYGGRKVLSRAFRNRFVELHFEEIPSKELEIILHQRCAVPPSYCSKLVAVMTELQTRRRGSGVFAGKQGFITLRDLFRWAERYRLASEQIAKFYDWDQHLADEGYLLLAGRVRNSAEEEIILEVLKKHFKKDVNPRSLFAADAKTAAPTTADIISQIICGGSARRPTEFEHVVWTFSMRRLAVLLYQALRFNEPVLMVGDTGCGKTTMCQMFAAISDRNLHAVNCHMHSEGADFLGGLRPVRHRQSDADSVTDDRLFEWVDGPLVLAMKEGSFFLADEISLADDSVLERLNSVLEPERTLLLAEKGGGGGDSDETNDVEIVAHGSFRFVATMNPGGDFGKKELSPALRNRFTEIWCPNQNSRDDLLAIVEHNLASGIGLCNTEDGTSGIGHAMLDFLDWFGRNNQGSRTVISVRDILAWVHFINTCCTQVEHRIDVASAYAHGASLILIDSLGSGTASHLTSDKVQLSRNACLEYLREQLECRTGRTYDSFQTTVNGGDSGEKHDRSSFEIIDDCRLFGLHPFYIETGASECHSLKGLFAMSASSTAINAVRVLRAMQLSKPILLEGSPGVGKTSLVVALAKASGHDFVRINLSEQTDISDLFGADLPVEGGQGGHFAWRDGPFLRALKLGHWVVLDELNLASQSVLEGLNACLDHRAEIYIPELGRTFGLPPGVKRRIFACQNPLHQGGARKGLPRSFLNRFTQVYVEPLSAADLQFIANVMFPTIPPEIIAMMVKFNQQVYFETVVQGLWGTIGGPWDVNLRDIFRWCEAMTNRTQNGSDMNPSEFVGLIYADRMRTKQDKLKVYDLCVELMPDSKSANPCCSTLSITKSWIQLGHAMLPRANQSVHSSCSDGVSNSNLALLPTQLGPLRSLMKCIEMNWMAILVGAHACGKTSLVTTLAQLTGATLKILNMNSDMDTTELLGGFEQVNLKRHLAVCSEDVCRLAQFRIQHFLTNGSDVTGVAKLTTLLNEYKQITFTGAAKTKDETKQFLRKIEKLNDILTAIDFLTDTNEYSELLAVRTKLTDLDQKVKAEDSLSCGGRFEWVDSLLVEALRNGHWLLIDNVNLCSPSVLDRLNALLEPNGVLTISERGILNGEIPTIVPNPSFRLILSMDTRNGEISRAMRNRGVEIFLHGEAEDLHFTEGELSTILNGIGLTDLLVQQCLIQIHRKIGQQLIGGDSLSLSDLIRAAQFIVQNIQEGCDIASSVRRSCLDVYVRCRYLTTKKTLAKTILEEILNSADIENNVSTNVASGHHHSTIAGCKMFLELATVKRDVVVLNCLSDLFINAEKLANSSVKTWYFLKFIEDFNEINEFRLERVFITALTVYLLRSSRNDWSLRLGVLSDVLQFRLSALPANTKSSRKLEGLRMFWVEIVEEMPSIFEHFNKILPNVNRFTAAISEGDVAYDGRWNPELTKLMCIDNRMVSSDSSSANRFTLLLKETVLKVKCGPLSSLTSSDEFIDFPRFDLASLFNMMSSAVSNRLYDPGLHINDDLAMKFDNAIHLLHCAQSHCAKLFLKKRFATDDMLQLKLHLKILFSKLFPLVFGAAWESTGFRRFPELFEVYGKITSYMDNRSIKDVNKHAAKLSSLLGSPMPFNGALEANICCRLYRLWTPDFNMLRHGSFTMLSKGHRLSFYFTSEAFQFRQRISNLLLKDVYLVEDRVAVESLEMELKSTTSVSKFDEEDGFPSTDIKSNPSAVIRDEFLPLVEHLAILQQQHLLCLIAKMSKGLNASSVLISLTSTVDNLGISVSATPTHLATLENLCNRIAKNEVVPKGLVIEIQYNFYEFCNQSALVNRSFREARELTHREESEHAITSVDYICRPQISIIIANLLLGHEKTIHTDSTFNLKLGFCEEKSNQFHRLIDIIWTNSASIGSNQFDPQLNDSMLFRKCLSDVAKAICSATGAFDLVVEIEELQQSNDFIAFEAVMDNVAKSCSILSGNLSKAWTEIDFCRNASLSWMNLGWLRMALLIPIFEVDPAEERKFQLNSAQEEISHLQEEIHVFDSQMFLTLGCTMSSCNPSSVHPRITYVHRRLKELKELVHQLEDALPYRPSPSQYEALRSQFFNYWDTIALKSIDAFKEWSNASMDSASETVSKIGGWLSSQSAFLNRIEAAYPMYRDLTRSCCLGIFQMMRGASEMMHKLKVAVTCDDIGFELSSIKLFTMDKLTFPYCSSISSDHDGVHLCPSLLTAQNMLDSMKSGLIGEDCHSLMQLLRSCIMEMKNQAFVTNTIQFGSSVFEHSVEVFATIWHHQEERRRDIEAENERTFVLRPREHGEVIDDEKELEAMIKKTFPTYREVFEDLIPSDTLGDSVNEIDGTEATFESDMPDKLSNEDIHAIVALYKEILIDYGQSRWYISDTSSDQKQLDVAIPLLTRYPVLARLMNRYGSLLENIMDSNSIGGHLLYISHQLHLLGTNGQDRRQTTYNFYRDANVAEVTNGQPILKRFAIRVKELLLEWPDHPTLQQLLKLIDRILNFSITSPVMKFITGFEMLLGQAQDWEKNAHKGVSLCHQLKEMTDQIIIWRKLELRCWSSCLNSIEDRAYANTSQWWLHLYKSMQLPSNQDDAVDHLSDLKNILQTFMEKSSLGEYKGRWELMFSLACFFTKNTPFRREVLESVWNLCEYYRQYIPVVEKLILQTRKPIEKALKEFIKIARWNDINFWAVKQSVDKSHRTLLKHMRNYEVALRQSMQVLFTDEDLLSRSETESSSKCMDLNIATYFVNKNDPSVSAELRLSIALGKSGKLTSLTKLRTKAQKLCRKLTRSCAFDKETRFLDEFVGDVIGSIHELQSLEIDKSATKEKQISQAKNINLRKRRALADLFKELSKFGLSYRKGLIGNPPDARILNLTPIDVAVSLNELNKKDHLDEFLLESWRDCPRYLHRSLARMALMCSSLQTPTKDLGPANIHRCQGYASQLMHLSVDQREHLAEPLNALSDMRFVVDKFGVIEENGVAVLRMSQSKLRAAIRDIKTMVCSAYLCLQQFRTLLDACPGQSNVDTGQDTVVLRSGQKRMAILDCQKGDLYWTETVATTNTCIESLEHLRSIICRSHPSACLEDGVQPWHTFSTVDGLLSKLETTMETFPLSNESAESLMESSLTLSLHNCREEILSASARVRESLCSVVGEGHENVVDVQSIVEILVKTILKAIENLVKFNSSDEEPNDDGEDAVDGNGLLVNSLHKKQIENVRLLNSRFIRAKLMELYDAAVMCSEFGENEKAKRDLELARQTVHLVEQYVTLAQFYLVALISTHRVTTKMASVLLGIFVELVRKGFCIPVEHSDDLSDGRSTKFEDDVAGTGIGEGEGLKDVSDRIENEDQLEEAHQMGTEKEDEDVSQQPDVKDEEHGIEMSDDFEGKVHDLDGEDANDEDKDEDDKSEEDGEEELEKQMGDLNGDDADKLDEKMWGSDEDEEDDDEEENEKSKKDEYGEGDGPKESRIVAKDDNEQRGEPDDDDEKPSPDDSEFKEGDVNMIDEREFDDRPNDLGEKNAEQGPEPEDMELPDDLDLDGKEEGGNEDDTEEKDVGAEDVENVECGGSLDEEASNEPNANEEACEDTVSEGDQDGDDVENKLDEEGVTENVERESKEVEEDASDTNRAVASQDKPTKEEAVQESEVNSKQSSADAVDAKAEVTQEISTTREQPVVNDNPNEDVAGDGFAESEVSEGHSSSTSSKMQQADRSSRQTPQRSRDKFGKSNEKRSLGSTDESIHKRLRTEDVGGPDEDDGRAKEKQDDESAVTNDRLTSDSYRHIGESERHYDAQTFDAATENQVFKQPQQPVPNRDDEEGESLEKEDNVQMMDRDEEKDNQAIAEKAPVLGNRAAREKEELAGSKPEGCRDDAMDDDGVLMDGEMMKTSGAQRGPETSFHTRFDEYSSQEIRTRDPAVLRRELEEQLQVWTESRTIGSSFDVAADEPISFSEAQDAWRKYEEVIGQLSRDLCEQLRLVLEPSLTAKLKGDYRTGKRLNMRKVIPYVASQFRKDKIWLRRTKPSKREYQIMLAVDDSSSMADNHSKQLAFEAMALICNALALLEAGEIGVASFGETVRLLHPLGEPFSDRAGAELLRQFTFEQQKTRVGMMLDVALSTMLESRKRIRGLAGCRDVAQLLVIVSDGRGLFNEGVDSVKRAVRRARESNLFTVFVIVDNSTNRDSILDIRVPVFKGAGQLPEIKSYMDDFPFPFYILLRDINGLPAILSEALRQWFELVTSAER